MSDGAISSVAARFPGKFGVDTMHRMLGASPRESSERQGEAATVHLGLDKRPPPLPILGSADKRNP